VLKWDAISNVYGYYVYRYEGNKRTLSKSVTTNQFSDAGVKTGVYRYEVVVYRINGGLSQPNSITVTVP
jgi:hypothetical protein